MLSQRDHSRRNPRHRNLHLRSLSALPALQPGGHPARRHPRFQPLGCPPLVLLLVVLPGVPRRAGRWCQLGSATALRRAHAVLRYAIACLPCHGVLCCVAHGQRCPWCGLYRQGLRNLGNTCFMNAVLQTLLASPVWRGVLLRRAGRATPERRASTPGDEPEVRTKRLRRPKSGRGHRRTSGGVGGSGDGAITNALVQCVRLAGSCSQRGEAHECLGLRRLCEQVWLGHDAVVAPSKLFQALCRRVPHFRKRRQQDSVEAFRYLLDGVDRESRSRQASDTPTIHQGWMLSCRVPLGAADSDVCACVCVLCVRVSLRVLDLSVQQSVMCVSGRWSRASCVSAAATLVVALRSLLIFRCHYTPRQACLTERSDG